MSPDAEQGRSGAALARFAVSSGACPFLHELGRTRGEAYAVSFALAPTRPASAPSPDAPSSGCPRHHQQQQQQRAPVLPADDAFGSSAAFAASLHAFHGAQGVLPLPRVVAGRSLAPAPARGCPFRAALLADAASGAEVAAAAPCARPSPAPPPRRAGICPFDHHHRAAAAAAKEQQSPASAVAPPLPSRRQRPSKPPAAAPAPPPPPLPLASMTLGGGGGLGGVGEFFERLKKRHQQQQKKDQLRRRAQQQRRQGPAAGGGGGGTGGGTGGGGNGSPPHGRGPSSAHSSHSGGAQPPAARKAGSPAPSGASGPAAAGNSGGLSRGPSPPGAAGGGGGAAASSPLASTGGGGCPLRAWLGPTLSGFVFDRYDRLVCPPPIVQARAALARTPPVRALRPQALPLKLVAVAAIAAAANLPCGAAREHFVKFSLGWVVAVHATVPFVAMLRKAVVMPPGAMVVTIAAAVAGQAAGARWERARLLAEGEKAAAVPAPAAVSKARAPERQQKHQQKPPQRPLRTEEPPLDALAIGAAIAAGLAAAAAGAAGAAGAGGSGASATLRAGSAAATVAAR
jgi:hypothetical protein